MRPCTVALALLAVVSATLGAQEPPRIPFTDSRLKFIQRVTAQPVEGVYANSVTADVLIGLDGRVESVTVIEGHDAHRASATAALRQYRFAPVLVNGKPARVITRLSVHVPDTLSADDLVAPASGSASTSVGARRDIVLAADCGRAIRQLDGSAEAQRTCRAALDAANQLPLDATSERRTAHRALAHVYMLARRWPDAIAEYQSALRIDTGSDADELTAAESLGMIATAYLNLGDLAAADRSAASAVARLESSMAAHPEHHAVHADMLRGLLLLHASVKRQRGSEAEALALERRAAATASSR